MSQGPPVTELLGRLDLMDLFRSASFRYPFKTKKKRFCSPLAEGNAVQDVNSS